ncbi:MAG TPA: prepilin-type N-terminal cleavage/methylation domain-containing protein, partial [Mycobacterium sp.]|uniref:prepilin-type N-terminal cleavage/methylation domain-containing protein n=1 Tax=Mycobacterium sp. TaxID=1785 RepID=UPI002D5E4BE6
MPLRREGSHSPAAREQRRSEAGDTLIEILIAIVIIAITASAVLGVLVESASASGRHRILVTLDGVLKSFAESAKYDIQYKPVSSEFRDCAIVGPASAGGPPSNPATYTILGSPTPTYGPVGTAVTVFGTGFAASSSLVVTMGTTSVPAASVVGAASDTNGNVAVTFPVPAGAVSAPITVTDAQGYTATSTDTFAVTPGTAVPTSPLESYHVDISAIGWWDSTSQT